MAAVENWTLGVPHPRAGRCVQTCDGGERGVVQRPCRPTSEMHLATTRQITSLLKHWLVMCRAGPVKYSGWLQHLNEAADEFAEA